MKRFVFPTLIALLLAPLTAWHAEEAPKKPAAKDKDYADQLPRIKPLEPAEAIRSFQPRPGFRVDLVAAEPLLRSPVAIDFDENGRLFVVGRGGGRVHAESHGASNQAPAEPNATDPVHDRPS